MPLGDEPKVQSLERRLERDLDLSSSISNWMSCSPTARSLSDTRRNVRTCPLIPDDQGMVGTR